MNIIVVNKSLAMMRGGGETRTLAFADGLLSRGHAITLVCAHPLLGPPRYAFPDGIEGVGVKAPYLRDWSYRVARGRGVLVRLDERLFERAAFRAVDACAGRARSGVDAVLTFGLFPLAWRIKRGLGIRVVVASSGGLPPGDVKEAARGVDAIVADGFDVRAIREHLGVDVVEVRKGVDAERFRPDPARESRSGRTRLVFVGRLVPVKSVHRLLPMLESLLAGGHDVRLDVAGDGPLREGLARDVRRRGLSGRVRLFGHLSPDDVAGRLRAADVFVLPSSFDNYPNAVLEAMSSGLPVVAFDVGGLADQVRHGDTGLLAPAGDEAAFAAHVASLVASPERRRAMGGRARAAVITSHDWSEAVDRLEAVLGAQAAA